jgi:hypothetical protein
MKTAASYLSAGLLLGFAGAYVGRVPLTFGQIAILAASGILFLCKDLFKRNGSKASHQLKSETLNSQV